ncbi:MAG: AmmeMemoRadiSam system protein A [Nitrospiraceae bacterium]|nr:AmmeMemoRadiSam system protein A [Nitrospiraceae bacterium]
MSGLVELARRSVEEFVRSREVICPPEPLPSEMSAKAGVFVCLKKDGQLRGCIGTFQPCCANIALETIRNAVASATQDPRFPAVSADELEGLSYSVDVLTEPEIVHDLGQLDPKEFGVIVAAGQKRGLLLPDLEGVDSVSEQLRIARMKAGIGPHEDAEIFRFRVRRFR